MTDEEMVVAQGQENHARKDLSYIEKARFAQRLEARFRRDTIMSAMSIHKSDLSNMLTVAHHDSRSGESTRSARRPRSAAAAGSNSPTS